MGQPQQEAAQHLARLGDGVGPRAEGCVVDEAVEHGGGRCRIKVRLEQGLDLLLDAFVDGALAEAVAAGDEEGGHQRFAVGKECKGEGGDVVGAEGVKLCRVGKDDGQHSDAFQQVEHAKAAYGAGLGAFHKGGPPCSAPPVPEALKGRVLGAIDKNMKLDGELFCQMI